MNLSKILRLVERLDRAYALLGALKTDTTQLSLVRIVAADAHSQVGNVIYELKEMVDRKVLK